MQLVWMIPGMIVIRHWEERIVLGFVSMLKGEEYGGEKWERNELDQIIRERGKIKERY